MRRKNWTPNDNSRLCALHFEEKSFILRGERKRLTSTAVPTIFSFFKSGKSMSTKQKGSESHTRDFQQIFDHTYSKKCQEVSEILEEDSFLVIQEPCDSHIVSDVDVEVTNDEEVRATHDHNYIVKESPKTLKRQLQKHLFSVGDKLETCRKKLKLEKKKTRRVIEKSGVSD